LFTKSVCNRPRDDEESSSEEEEDFPPFWSVTGNRCDLEDCPENVVVNSNRLDRSCQREVAMDWFNSARMSFDDSNDTITFNISTGDPRGSSISLAVTRDEKTGLRLQLDCREDSAFIRVDCDQPKRIVVNQDVVEANYVERSSDHEELCVVNLGIEDEVCHCGQSACFEVSEKNKLSIIDMRDDEVVEATDGGESDTLHYLCKDCVKDKCKFTDDNNHCTILMNKAAFKRCLRNIKKKAPNLLLDEGFCPDVAIETMKIVNVGETSELYKSVSPKLAFYDDVGGFAVGVYRLATGKFECLFESEAGEQKRFPISKEEYDTFKKKKKDKSSSSSSKKKKKKDKSSSSSSSSSSR
jgi:hypothetical protein